MGWKQHTTHLSYENQENLELLRRRFGDRTLDAMEPAVSEFLESADCLVACSERSGNLRCAHFARLMRRRLRNGIFAHDLDQEQQVESLCDILEAHAEAPCDYCRIGTLSGICYKLWFRPDTSELLFVQKF